MPRSTVKLLCAVSEQRERKMLKHLTFAALASTAFAQTTPQDLNATLANTPELSNLTTYLGMFPDVASSLASATNITILAPNNDAFSKLLASPMGSQLATNPGLIQAVLTYHVLNGTYASNQITEDSQFIPTLLTDSTYTNVTGGQRVGVEEEDDRVVFYSGLLMNSTVTQADVQFSGGVVHIIDTVLTVPANASTTALAANLTALAGALTTADLVAAVDTTPDLTIFAPTNAAFAAIGGALANATTAQLTDVLTYHVVNGTVAYSAGLQPSQTVRTLNGAELTIRVLDDGDVFVNGAKVVVADVLVANGVVHVIDK
ncbi:hypothetical protein SLS56_001148 [Neofusicoccum ribis]|uniref:FAS1 domain-containing protein n=1 Tax=Neofusicoccum ribis TaxID=45134 RepID=A0ABR3TAI4_9PEZI